MNLFRYLVAALVLFATAVQAKEDPLQLVRTTSNFVLEQVSAQRDALKKDSSGIYVLVEREVSPHFDFMKMAQGAMGQNWTKANDDQRTRLAREFQEMLVRTYALALLSYSNEQIEYLPIRSEPEADKATVATQVRKLDGPPVPISYKLYDKGGKWLIYDVTIDGVSLVANYRTSFADEVRRGGVDGLIASLSERNQKLRSGG